jgi:hypothetical protein
MPHRHLVQRRGFTDHQQLLPVPKRHIFQRTGGHLQQHLPAMSSGNLRHSAGACVGTPVRQLSSGHLSYHHRQHRCCQLHQVSSRHRLHRSGRHGRLRLPSLCPWFVQPQLWISALLPMCSQNIHSHNCVRPKKDGSTNGSSLCSIINHTILFLKKRVKRDIYCSSTLPPVPSKVHVLLKYIHTRTYTHTHAHTYTHVHTRRRQ